MTAAPVRLPAQGSPGVWTVPSWVMLAAVIAIGGWRIASLVHASFGPYPVATMLAVILFGLYAVPFVVLLRMIDYLESQPAVLQATAFAWGAVVATSAAISGGTALQDVLAKTVSPSYATQWGPAVVAAGLEEILKVAGVLAIAVTARAHFTGLIDGFVYGALVGLGFQVVEDILVATNAVAVEGGVDQVRPVLVTLVLRGFVAGLWSHTLFSALAGTGVAYAVLRPHRPPLVRIAAVVGLFGAAWGGHFLWNSPLLGDGFGGAAGAIGALLVKGIPAVAVAVTLLVAAERREADYFAALLAGLGDPKVATQAEIVALVSPRRRLAARRRARLRLGPPGARALRRLQRTQAQLAVAVSRSRRYGTGPDVLRRRCDVLARRHQLLALDLAAGGAGTRRSARIAFSAAAIAPVLLALLVLAAIAVAIRSLGGS